MKASDLTLQSDCAPARFQQLIKASVHLAFLFFMGALDSEEKSFMIDGRDSAVLQHFIAAAAMQAHVPFLVIPARSHEDCAP